MPGAIFSRNCPRERTEECSGSSQNTPLHGKVTQFVCPNRYSDSGIRYGVDVAGSRSRWASSPNAVGLVWFASDVTHTHQNVLSGAVAVIGEPIQLDKVIGQRQLHRSVGQKRKFAHGNRPNLVVLVAQADVGRVNAVRPTERAQDMGLASGLVGNNATNGKLVVAHLVSRVVWYWSEFHAGQLYPTATTPSTTFSFIFTPEHQTTVQMLRVRARARAPVPAHKSFLFLCFAY